MGDTLAAAIEGGVCLVAWLALVGYGVSLMWARSVLSRWHEECPNEDPTDADLSWRYARLAIVPMCPSSPRAIGDSVGYTLPTAPALPSIASWNSSNCDKTAQPAGVCWPNTAPHSLAWGSYVGPFFGLCPGIAFAMTHNQEARDDEASE